MTAMLRQICAAALGCFSLSVDALGQGAAHIRITGEASGKNSLSLAGVRHDGSDSARLFLQVLRDNLQRSGWFQMVDGTSAGIVLKGQALGSGGTRVAVSVEWLPSNRFDWTRSGTVADARPLALELTDEIVRRVMRRPGMASAPIIFVGKRGGKTDVYSCDADGGRLRQITTDGQICLSPKWIPDRSGFLYTSFLKGYGAIYKVTLGANANRELVAGYPGLNMGGCLSPDGKLAAMVLSITGNVELYVKNMATGKLTQRTFTKLANESSPNWSPDGSQIAYVSDIGRSPQVYVMHKNTREGKRFVYGMSESVSPDWGPDGRIAFCGRQAGRYAIYVQGAGGQPQRCSPDDGTDYEDPSWAPDARHIVCTQTLGGRRRLVVLDTMGDPPVVLHATQGDWYLADWSK
jgi:TolB protein